MASPKPTSAKDLLLICGATVVNAAGSQRADVLCEDGKIAAVGPDLDGPAGARVLDAGGLLVLPGGIDPHTHLEMPVGGHENLFTADSFEDGGRAALSGGTTTVIDFLVPRPGQSLLEAHGQVLERAATSTVHYGLHATVSWWSDQVARELTILAREHGVTSFKHFMAYPGTLMLDDAALLASFRLARELGCLCTVHAENGAMIGHLQRQLLEQGITHPKGHPLSRPPIVEAEATNRAIALAQVAGAPLYVVHLSCKPALEAVAQARAAGFPIFAECLCGHLCVDESVYFQDDPAVAARYVMSPPYRTAEHREALWHGLASGSLQVTASDNCTFTQAQRGLGKGNFARIPNGAPGIEERMRIVWDMGVGAGRLTPEQFVAATSTNAACLFNLEGKGAVRAGADADLVLWDPEASHTVSVQTHRQAIDYNVFEGMTFTGSPAMTILDGKIVYADGEVTAEAGCGRYLKRPSHGPLFQMLERRGTGPAGNLV